jgi:formylglycine-generating enzyme required for sulfatase activity
VNDRYGDYAAGAQIDPPGPTTGSDRVFRGGGWSSGSGGCRASIRYVMVPFVDFDFLGFRAARTP